MDITPYIIFDGDCEEALNLYVKALDGEIKHISRYGDMPGEPMHQVDKNKIMHATFEAGAVKIMASDSGMGPLEVKGGQVHLSLNFEDGAKMEKVFNALAEGGHVEMPLQDTFWGARFGMLKDKHGVEWMFNHELPKK